MAMNHNFILALSPDPSISMLYISLGMGLETKLFVFYSVYCHFFMVQNPHMYLMAAVFSLTGYLGINFVLVLVRSFGALLAVTGTFTIMWLLYVSGA